MTFGLLVKDGAGREIIGPSTFTVRLIDRFPLVQGQTVYSRPKVRAGMFCAFQSTVQDSYAIPPAGSCWDGGVSLSPLLWGGGYSETLECLVLGYV